ncbi:MAG TPA: hypothetical protein VF077_05440 [Nitrospiraceae bacterium]
MAVVSCKNNAHSVTSAEVNLEIDNNGTWMDAFQFGKPNDHNWTLKDQTFELDVQRNAYDLVPLLSLTTVNGRIIVDDENQRVIHFNVPAADIQENLDPGIYVYDLVMINAFDQRVPLMHGTLEVVQGVTYPP